MIVMSTGGGTNSMAMLIGLRDAGVVPDVIVFADTGSERPHTYEYMQVKREWLKRNGFPDLTVVRNTNKHGQEQTLEQDCLNRGALPSIAYGFKSCSQKFKIQPIDKFLNHHPMALDVWKNGGKVVKLIGYDADESHRIRDYDDQKYTVAYPLLDYGWVGLTAWRLSKTRGCHCRGSLPVFSAQTCGAVRSWSYMRCIRI